MTKPISPQLIDSALFRIDWGRLSRKQEQALLEACPRPTLPQTPAYAAALAESGHAETEFGVMRFHDRPVGFVYVERRPLMGRVSSYRIYRGPLWLDNNFPISVQREFIRLAQIFKSKCFPGRFQIPPNPSLLKGEVEC